MMRIAFAGTPEFAATALEAILHAGFHVPLVLTQPDRPAGRGMALQPSAVKTLALKHGLSVHQPLNLKSEEARQPIIDAKVEVMVVAAYGLILPQTALDIPQHGCLNIHASLLPRWRGAAPIHRAILAGDRETGVTIMRMDAGLDTGPMLLKAALPIADEDTTQTLHDKLAALGASLLIEALQKLSDGSVTAIPQPEDGATYAAKIEKREAELDWRQPAADLVRAVRAFNPFPTAIGHLNGAALKIGAACVVEGRGDAGTVLAVNTEGIVVACGQQALNLMVLQKPGGKRLPVSDFLRGFPVQVGEKFALQDNA